MTEEKEQQLIDKLIDAVSKHVKPPVPINIALWDTAMVATYLCRDPAAVRDRITPLPSFPKAIRLPAKQGKAHPLYKAAEVIAWVEKHQERH